MNNLNDTTFLTSFKSLGSSVIQNKIEAVKTQRQVFAYGRVSTENQNLGIQLDKFNLLGIKEKNIYVDQDSGKNDDRDQLQELLKVLRKGDKIVFYDLTRLGRNPRYLFTLVDHFQQNGIEFQDLTNPHINTESTRTAEGELIFGIFALIGSFFRRQSNEKVLAGLKRYKDAGGTLGRPAGLSKKLKKIASAVVMMHKNPTTTLEDICSTFQISKGSIYKIFKHEGYDYKAYHKNHNNKNASKI